MTDEAARCDACGARNPEGAAWCSQCYLSQLTPRLGPAAQIAESTLPVGLLPLPPPAPGPAPATPMAAGGGRFRESSAGLEWACVACDEWNLLDRIECTMCGAHFGRLIASATPLRPTVTPGVLVAGSMVMPGLGHLLLGLRGQAFTRMVLGAIWGAGGLSLLLKARSRGQSLLPAIPLLVGWVVLAIVSANDAHVEGGSDGRVVLGSRTLLWLVVGVLGATTGLALVSTVLAANG
jgi:hypothetical protein